MSSMKPLYMLSLLGMMVLARGQDTLLPVIPTCQDTCTPDHEQCGSGPADPVSACCTPGYQCVNKAENQAFCVAVEAVPDLMAVDSWAGDVRKCEVPEEPLQQALDAVFDAASKLLRGSTGRKLKQDMGMYGYGSGTYGYGGSYGSADAVGYGYGMYGGYGSRKLLQAGDSYGYGDYGYGSSYGTTGYGDYGMSGTTRRKLLQEGGYGYGGYGSYAMGYGGYGTYGYGTY